MSITKRKKSVTADIFERIEQRSGYFFVLIFFFLVIGIALIGYFSYRKYQHTYRDQVERNLSVVTNQKVDELVDWRQERLGDASIFCQNPVFTSLVRDFIRDPKNADTRWRIQTWMGKIQKNFKYKQVCLFDTQGASILSVPANPLPVSTVTLQYLPKVLRSGQVTFQDFYRNNYDQRIYLSVLVPILDEKNHNQPLAVLALCIDPNVYLYPFIQKWPSDSKTAETLLVRRDGNDALFLNELKFQKDAALKLRFSLDKKEFPAVKAVLGQEGIVEGKDYRDVPVLACLRAVPDSPWFLVARMDTAEVYAPLRERLGAIVILVIILLFGAAIGLNILRRQQNLRFYRKQSELTETLKNTHVNLLNILDNMDGLVYVVDMETYELLYMNKFGRDTWGGDYAGKKCWQVIQAEQAGPCEFCTNDKLLKPDGSPSGVYVWEFQNTKNNRWYDCRDSVIKWFDGRTVRMEIATDITARKQAEEEIRFLSSVTENITDAITVTSVNFVITYMNEAAEQMFGYTLGELKGKTPNIFNAEPTSEQIQQELYTTISSGKIYLGESLNRKKDGSTFYCEYKVMPLKDKDGKIIAYTSIQRDITERKQAEEEKNSLQEQLIRSEKLAAVGELIAGVVHEINNPLTGIKGLSELLLNETQDEEKKKDLKFIHQSSERIEKIVKNLQRFAHREKPSRKYVNINELIDVVISIRDYEMKARNIKVERHYQPDLPLVFTDPSQLEQVFLNLITNAEYAIHDNQEKAGTLTVATSVVLDNAGGTVAIEFADTGAGIPEDVLPKIFNPFFTTKGVGKGTGLGLSVSYGIIKGHGGEISAGNRAEGGAVFTIKLPVRGGG